MVTVTNKATPPRKTKPKGRHPDKALSAASVRTAPPGRHADGNGLYLFVQPSGTRSWIQRLVIRSVRHVVYYGLTLLGLLWTSSCGDGTSPAAPNSIQAVANGSPSTSGAIPGQALTVDLLSILFLCRHKYLIYSDL